MVGVNDLPVSLWHSLRYSHLWPVHARRSARLRLWLTRRISYAAVQIAFPDAFFRKPGQLFIAGENVIS